MVSPSAVSLVMHESRGAFIHMCVEFKAVRVNENKHSHQLQTGFREIYDPKIDGNETRSSCDNRLFFSLRALPLVVTVCRELSGLEKFLWNPG